MSIILCYFFELRRIEFDTIRYLSGGHLVDLGAQYVYKETTDTTSEIKWPFAIMGRELCGFHRYIMYDSSGTRLDDNIANYFEEVYENSDLGTSISSEENRVLSVGEYIKRA